MGIVLASELSVGDKVNIEYLPSREKDFAVKAVAHGDNGETTVVFPRPIGTVIYNADDCVWKS